MFTSKTTRGFYDESVHGPLTIFVPDPAWAHPKITITLAPGESYVLDGVEVTNTSDEPMLLEVPDPEVVAPLVEIANPNTLIPPDAVEITKDEWQALIDGQSAGQMIDWNEEGYAFLTDQPPPTPEEILTRNTATKNNLLAAATLAIAPLQDAVDIGEATPEEEALLLLWKKYRVAVNRVGLTLADPVWPPLPA